MGRFVGAFVLMFGVAGTAPAVASNGWSAPVPVTSDHSGSANTLGSVSCASSSFCAATDGTGNLFTYNGSYWSAITLDGFSGGVASLSCPSDSLCAGQTDESQEPCDCYGVMTYDAISGTWKQQTFESISGEEQDYIYAVSCASGSFCMAIGIDPDNSPSYPCQSEGEWAAVYSIYNGTQWSAVTPFCESVSAEASDLDMLSCPSSAFCMAIDNGADVYTYNGSGWAPAPGPPSGTYFGGGTPGGLSCASSTFCVAAQGQNGSGSSALIYNGTEWSSVPIPNPADYPDVGNFSGVSCPTASFCLGVFGGAAIYDGSGWGDAEAPDSGHPGDALNAVSCISSSFCMAIDDAGYALTYTGSSSSSPGSGSSGSGTPPTTTEPGAPSGPLRATRITATSITLSWGAPEHGPTPADYAILIASGPRKGSIVAFTPGRKWTVRRLRARTRYRFTVYSVDTEANGVGKLGASLTGPWMRTR